MKKSALLLLIIIQTLGLAAQPIVYETDASGNRVRRYSDCDNQPINLGEDLSFCSGETHTLDAGTGFVSYKWNGEAGTSQLEVSSPGTYQVEAVNEQGCKSYDTIEVTVNDIPVVNLGADQTTAADAYVYLEADAGYQSYQWTGNNTCRILCVPMQDITANQVTINLAVTDTNGCTGSDDVQLIKETQTVSRTKATLAEANKENTIEESLINNETEQVSYNIYPNPADGRFFIAVSNPEKVKRIALYSIHGNLVHTYTTIKQFPFEVDMSDQPKGIYLLRVSEEDNKFRQFKVVNK